ncbi:MAG: 4Fe-4S binding protein [Candidatus Bathyarchaeia archaeon]
MARILLKFSEDTVNKPVTAEVILEQKVPINILAAYIDQQGGKILVEIPQDHLKSILEAFHRRGVTTEIHRSVNVDDKKCLNCGACYSLCPANAINFKEDFSVIFNKEKCLGGTCLLCVDSCPVRAIKLAE